MDAALTVTSAHLLAAFKSWEQDARADLCRPLAESAALPADQAAAENLEHFTRRLQAAGAMQLPPRIGQLWPEQGGIYLGLVRGADGQPDHHLILAAAMPGKRLKWSAAKAWAAKVTDGGFADWRLPSKGAEAWVLCAAGVAEKRWHWLAETEGSHYAWYCGFSYGSQHDDDRSAEGAAVAVRSFIAESFNPSEQAP